MSSIYLILRNKAIISVNKDFWSRLFSELSRKSSRYGDTFPSRSFDEPFEGIQIEYYAVYIEILLSFTKKLSDSTGNFEFLNPVDLRKFSGGSVSEMDFIANIFLHRNCTSHRRVLTYDNTENEEELAGPSKGDIMSIIRTKEELMAEVLTGEAIL